MKHYGNMNIVTTRLHLELQMAGFRDCLHVCELKDHKFSGLPYTYDNKRARIHNVRFILDSVVVGIFLTALVVHLVTPCPDHAPILLSSDRK
jgi:hypothetical protein